MADADAMLIGELNVAAWKAATRTRICETQSGRGQGLLSATWLKRWRRESWPRFARGALSATIRSATRCSPVFELVDFAFAVVLVVLLLVVPGLGAGLQGALRLSCPGAAGTGLAHIVAGPMENPVRPLGVTLTVPPPRGDANPGRCQPTVAVAEGATAMPMLEGQVDAVLGVDPHRDPPAAALLDPNGGVRATLAVPSDQGWPCPAAPAGPGACIGPAGVGAGRDGLLWGRADPASGRPRRVGGR
jgi:hypothetical protein